MQIRVLGPVEVLVDGHVRPLPAAGERELLAVLALAAGRVVPVPALIDALWGEQLPGNPGNALQVRVSKLRRVLTAAGVGDVLLTRPPGYLLDVDPLSVDALRFADLLAAARAAAGVDPEVAAEAFALLERADRQFARAGDAWCAALSDFVRLGLHAGTGALDEATAVSSRALLAFRALGDQWGVSAIQFHLGMALHRAGRLEQALEMYEGALASVRDVGPANTVQYALAGAGHAARAVLGDRAFDEAYRAGAVRSEAVLDAADQAPARR